MIWTRRSPKKFRRNIEKKVQYGIRKKIKKNTKPYDEEDDEMKRIINEQILKLHQFKTGTALYLDCGLGRSSEFFKKYSRISPNNDENICEKLRKKGVESQKTFFENIDSAADIIYADFQGYAKNELPRAKLLFQRDQFNYGAVFAFTCSIRDNKKRVQLFKFGCKKNIGFNPAESNFEKYCETARRVNTILNTFAEDNGYNLEFCNYYRYRHVFTVIYKIH